MTDSYIALDLEDDGVKPGGRPILEIGAIRVEGGRILERYETLLNPGIRISPRIQELTGITDEMAAGGKDTRLLWENWQSSVAICLFWATIFCLTTAL